MTESLLCLDSSVLIKLLAAEEPEDQREAAARLMERAYAGWRMIAPAFAWVEVGSSLRKKVRQGTLPWEEAERLWSEFGLLPIEYVELPAARKRAWEIAERHGLATLYDAAFLACTELAHPSESTVREYWTADEELLRRLGADMPAYVRRLGE